MMAHFLVSIIIPCYNGATHIGDAIRSALAQTYLNKEVIVIDDGSTDNSLDVIKSFGDAVRWETGPNRGGCMARNRGVEISRGDLIQFLDADDLLIPEKLERQVGLIAGDPDCLVYCNGECLGLKGERSTVNYARQCNHKEDPVLFMLKGGLATPAPIHWKKNIQMIGGFRATLPCSQERDLHLRLACTGVKFRHLQETLYTVRRFSGSVSSDFVKLLDQHSNIAWSAFDLLQSRHQLTESRAAGIAGMLAADARAYLKRGLRHKAKDYFAQARRIHPEGGIPQTYSRKARWLLGIIGPVAFEQLVEWKWHLLSARIPNVAE